jgi:hypothetical protein
MLLLDEVLAVCELGGVVDVAIATVSSKLGWPTCREGELTYAILDPERLTGRKDLSLIRRVDKVDNVAATRWYAGKEDADVAGRSIG